MALAPEMNPATAKLHETLIRLIKGVISAWEEWLKAQVAAGKMKQDKADYEIAAMRAVLDTLKAEQTRRQPSLIGG